MQAIVETTKMSTKGQVIIPKHTREFTHSSENTSFTVFPLSQDTIVLKKIDNQKLIEEFRRIRKNIKEKLSENDIDAIIHRTRQEKSRP